jgi:xylulokinase
LTISFAYFSVLRKEKSIVLTASAAVVDSQLKLVAEAKVEFDVDLPQYGTTKGVLTLEPDGDIVTPPSLWLEALDLVLQRLKDTGLDIGRVKSISGAGAQHGTVFWSLKAETLLAALEPGRSLVEQLGLEAFSHGYSPNWQDATTQSQCEQFDQLLGGPEQLADVTGSKAHHVSSFNSLITQGFSGLY